MKKTYQTPILKIDLFDGRDILTESDPNGNVDEPGWDDDGEGGGG